VVFTGIIRTVSHVDAKHTAHGTLCSCAHHWKFILCSVHVTISTVKGKSVLRIKWHALVVCSTCPCPAFIHQHCSWSIWTGPISPPPHHSLAQVVLANLLLQGLHHSPPDLLLVLEVQHLLNQEGPLGRVDQVVHHVHLCLIPHLNHLYLKAA